MEGSESTASIRQPSGNGLPRAWMGVILIGFVVATRIPALVHPHPIDDEHVYSVVATEMVYGGLPYEAAIERKPPLLFWTYAIIFHIVGPYNWFGLHVAAVLWTLGIVAGVYWIARILFSERAGFAAAFLTAVFHSWGPWKNLAFNGEMLMNLPIVMAIALTVRRSCAVTRWELVGAGVLLCIAFLLKQPAAIAAVPLGIYLLLPAYRQDRQLRPIHSLLHGAMLTAGFFGTLALVAVWLDHLGILEEAYYWTIGDHDVPHGPLDRVFWMRGLGMSSLFVLACAPLVMLAARSLRDGWSACSRYWDGRSAEWLLLVLLVVASLVGVSTPGRFYPHYFIQLVPPLAVLAAPVAARFVPPASIVYPFERLLYLWLAATVAGFLSVHVSGLPPEPGDVEAIEYLREHAEEGDRLFVWGHAPGVYVETRMRPASRYVLTFPLTGYIFGSPLSRDPHHDTRHRILPGAWDSLRVDFRRHPPEFLYDDESVRSPAKYPARDFRFLHRLLERNYESVLETSDGVLYRRSR